MVRRHSLRYLLVLTLSLVMTAGLIAPAVADSEGESVVVTAQVLPFLEVSLDRTAVDFGPVPSVWEPADEDWRATFPFVMTVTSNLPYATNVIGRDASTNLSIGIQFHIAMQSGPVSFGVSPTIARTAYIEGPAALNSVHPFGIILDLHQDAMPIPPGTINYTVIFTVSQVI